MAVSRIDGFFFMEMYGRFTGTKKRAVKTRWPLGGFPLYSKT